MTNGNRPRRSEMINKLKENLPSGMSMDVLMELAIYARLLSGEYVAQGVDTPDWLIDARKRISAEIKSRASDALHLQLEAAKLRLAALKTPDERRKDTADEIARLEEKLATTA